MQEYHYFVAHEFSRQKRDDLRESIEEAFRGSGLRAYYADIEVRQKHILEKIEERILTTQFGIYDVTNENPNVCLELGIARGAKKPYYIILEKGTKLPTDLDGLDRIEYKSYKDLTKQMIRKKIVKVEVNRLREKKILEQYEEIPEKEVIEKCYKLYQAEELLHRFGNEVEDEDASNKKAWFADLSQEFFHIIFGPYEPLIQLGEYIAFFKIKIDDNSSSEPVLLLDVMSGTGRGGAKGIRGVDFRAPNKYQLFGIKFKCQGTEPMEYRIYNFVQRGKIWIDYVAIVKMPLSTK